MRDQLAEVAADAGMRVTVTPESDAPTRAPDRVLDQQGWSGDPRWAHAKARIFRILEGAGQASTIAQGVKNAEMPKLAREYMDLVAHYKFFRHRRSRWNPFLDMSDADAAKKFINCIFNICDRSTGKLGPWYVK